MRTAEPPSNFRIGLNRSLAVRGARSEKLSCETWAVVVALASGVKRVAYDAEKRTMTPVEITTPPTTLAEFADALNDLGRCTSRGARWSPQTLQRVFKARGETPKTLRESLLPQPFRERMTLPERIDLFGTLRLLTEHENQYGVWMAAIIRQPRALDWVRLRISSEDDWPGAIFSVRERTRSSVQVSDTFGAAQKLRLIDIETWVPKRGKLE